MRNWWRWCRNSWHLLSLSLLLLLLLPVTENQNKIAWKKAAKSVWWRRSREGGVRSDVSFSDPTLCTQKWRLDSLFLLPLYVFCVFFCSCCCCCYCCCCCRGNASSSSDSAHLGEARQIKRVAATAAGRAGSVACSRNSCHVCWRQSTYAMHSFIKM